MNLDQMIAEAETALHELYMGKSAVRVKIEGEETEFNRVKIADLEAYIARLKARKAGQASRGAIGFVF